VNREELRELAAAKALGRLSPDELAAFEASASDDPALARELEADRATVGALEARVARRVPSDDLLDRIMAEVESYEAAETAASAASASKGASRRTLRLPGWPRLALGGVAAAAAVVVGIALLDGGRGEPDALAALTGAPEYSSVTGEAKLYDRESGRTLVIRLRSTPPPPAGHHYEVWVLRKGVESMEPAGELTVAANHTEDDEHEFRLAGAGSLDAVNVSVEPNDGNPDHSGVNLAGGRFSS